MIRIVVLLLCVFLLPAWVTAQKGFVKGKLGEELDDLMTSLAKKVIQVRCLLHKTPKSFCVKVMV